MTAGSKMRVLITTRKRAALIPTKVSLSIRENLETRLASSLFPLSHHHKVRNFNESLHLIDFNYITAMYYYNLVQALEGIGYTRDVDMLGAPYDWRRAPRKFTCLLQ